jgi:mono/diheme cytochrome c family protein
VRFKDAAPRAALAMALACCARDQTEHAVQRDAARDSSISSAASNGPDLFFRCSICHGEQGAGQPGVYPPLTRSAVMNGPASIPIRIVMGGLEGPITVNGEQYDSAMSPWGDAGPMTDAELAALLTYIRTSWGNTGSVVTAAEVAKERPSVAGRVALWTAAELGIR